MLPLLSGECVHMGIVRGLRRREPTLDIVTVREVGLDNTPDPDILEWAATEGRVIITGDVNTLIGFARGRVQLKRPMAGVLALRQHASMGRLLDDILLLAECCTSAEVEGQIIFVPF